MGSLYLSADIQRISRVKEASLALRNRETRTDFHRTEETLRLMAFHVSQQRGP